MDCDTAREALSARIDGEAEPVPSARVDEHLETCEPCRQWQAAAAEQTLRLRHLAGRSQLSAVRPAPVGQPALIRRPSVSWRRWALGAVGLIQSALAIAQGMGAELGLPHAASAGHVLNESTAWSAALGVAMLAAAIRPMAAGGLAWVLFGFAGFLVLYEITDAHADHVSLDRPLTHLPVVAAAVLSLLIWRHDRPESPHPDRTAATPPAGDANQDNESAIAVRRQLRSADDSAA